MCIHQQATGLILDEYLMILFDSIVTLCLDSFFWLLFCGDMFFKDNPQIFCKVDVRALGKTFQKLNVIQKPIFICLESFSGVDLR